MTPEEKVKIARKAQADLLRSDRKEARAKGLDNLGFAYTKVGRMKRKEFEKLLRTEARKAPGMLKLRSGKNLIAKTQGSLSIEEKFKTVKLPGKKREASAAEYKARPGTVELGRIMGKLRTEKPPKPRAKRISPAVVPTKPTIRKLSPREQKANYREFRMRMAAREGAKETGLLTITNASGHTVKVPDGPFMHFRDKQKEALRLAKELKGADRKFALELAKQAAKEKRGWDPRRPGVSARYAASRSAQKRVPKGQSGGGRWTK